MKQDELYRLATCNVCERKIGETGLPVFYKVTVERFGLDALAIRRQAGLEAFLGSPAIASVMGENADLATPIMRPTEVTVCERCSHSERAIMAALEKSEPDDDADGGS